MDVIDRHGAALEYDLLTMTRYQLRDAGGALSWGALLHFLQYLPRDSALSRELVPLSDSERWAGGEATSAIVADLFDLVALMRAEAAVKGTTHRPRKPRRYPRPWERPKERHVGRGAIPIADFEDWWKGGNDG